jgi:hypothetical protein
MAESPTDLYRGALLELWNGQEGRIDELAAALVSDGFVIHQARAGGGGSERVKGPEALAQLVRAGRAPFDDVNVTLDVGPIAEGDMVAARWTFRGRYAGGIPGATAPEGTEVAFSGIDIMRAEGGRLVEYWVSSDADHLMAQLGAG